MNTPDSLMQYNEQAMCPNCGHLFTVNYDGEDYIPIAYNDRPFYARVGEVGEHNQPCPDCGAALVWPTSDMQLA